MKCVTHRHVIENYSLFHGHHSSVLLDRTLRKKKKLMCAAHLTSRDKLMFSCCDFSILMKTFHTIITLQGVQALQEHRSESEFGTT